MLVLYYWSMNIASPIRTGRYCVFNMHVHLVFVAKYRKKVFQKVHIDFMQTIFSDVCKSFEAELKVALSKLVNSLKGVSSRLLRKNFPSIHVFYWKGVLWSPSYFAGSCGGAPIEIVKKYIEQQTTPE